MFLKIVSIVGLGGLGKTTLAKAVYNKLNAQYHTRAFTPVGQNPNVKNILKNILYACGKDLNAENLDARQLCDELHKLLKNKRYFIVIDDIWDPLNWNGIRSAFPENTNGSKVMITTRDHRVAFACCNSERKYVYEIKPLNHEESKRLFFRRTFGPEKDCADTCRKEEISKHILKRCGGMPLAINSIASLLNGEEDTTWENVWKSLGDLTEGKTAVDNMNEILDLSYIHLPDDLKTCMLYVCKYPEDWEIEKNDLLRQWVAEGFVSRKGRLDAEDVAENNFKALINMCMIEPGKLDYNNEVLSCRVHDIILDLMRSKSAKLNFIHVTDGSNYVKETLGKIRRVSVQCNSEKHMSISDTINKGSLSCVRSVSLYTVPFSYMPHFLEFKYIRVLELRQGGSNFQTVDFTGISMLFLLSYLKIGFSGKRVRLPNQIGELQQLETIHLSPWNFPSDIIRLPRLMHLTSQNCTLFPDGISRLKSLRTLEGVTISSLDNIKGLGELTNLRSLHIRISDGKEENTERMKALHCSISRLSSSLRILSLNICWDQWPTVIGWSSTPFLPGSHIGKLDLSLCRFERCPEWIGQLHHLYSLTITVTEVADGVSIVARLPSLVHFDLAIRLPSDKEEKEESVVISGSGAFQALKHLIFDCSKALLTFEKGVLPKLETLSMLFCYHTIHRSIPAVGIEHLPAPILREIDVKVHIDFSDDDWGHKMKWSKG